MIKQATHSYKHKGFTNPTMYKVKEVKTRFNISHTHVWFWDTYTNKWIKSYCHPPVYLMKELVCSTTT